MYDALSRKVPVGFSIHNYGATLESIKFSVLTPQGAKDADEMPMHMLYDDDGCLMISDAIKHPELQEFYLVIEVTDMDSAGAVESDRDPLFCVEILAVSPKSVTEDDLNSALDSSGPGKDDPSAADSFTQAESLVRYGKAAHLWQASSDDKDQLIAEAKKRLAKVQGMLGFYLDQPQNRMGDTGWSWIASPNRLKEG